MTKTEFRKNYRKLVRRTTKMLLAYEQAALDSGAFSLGEARGVYTIPRNVLTAALRDAAAEWEPRSWNLQRKAQIMTRNIQKLTYPKW